MVRKSGGGSDASNAESIARYKRIIEHIFFSYYRPGDRDVAFMRGDIVRVAQELGVDLPKNLGDVVYSFRYRTALPESIREKAPEGEEWVIRSGGRARYRFELTSAATITPNMMSTRIKIPDATPGVITMHALSDEQSLLAKIRYNGLIDIFTGVKCYSLQNHLRTTVESLGQIETDEVYIGIDRWGAHYVFPVQAKVGKDKIGIVQIEQDFALCASKFPGLIARPIAAQLVEDDVIALFEFVQGEDGVSIPNEKHYRLVLQDEMTSADLYRYRSLSLPSS